MAKKAVNAPSEHAIQAAFIQWCRTNRWRYPELAISFAVPNGGQRHVIVAMKLKAEGVEPGIPDWVLPVPRETFAGLMIEFKAGKNGLTLAQKEKIPLLEAAGWRVEVCRDWEIAVRIVKSYLNS